MKRRIALVLVSIASIAGAAESSAAAIDHRPLLVLDVRVVVEAPRPTVELSPAPSLDDLEALTRREVERLRDAGASRRELKPLAGSRLYRDRSGDVFAVARRGARPVPTGLVLRGD